MSEEERKEEKQKPRIVSIIALIEGIATFVCGLFIVPFTLWFHMFPDPGIGIDVIWILLLGVALCSTLLFVPLAIIGLVLSIITLFVERDIYLRAAPLTLVLFGILLYPVCYASLNML